MRYLNSFDTIECIDSAEIVTDSFPKTKNVGLLAIPQSVETKDVINAIQVAENQHTSIPIFSVINIVGSHIACMTGLWVYTYAGREHAVASTKAFISQVTVLSLISSWFSQQRDNIIKVSDNDSLRDNTHRRHILIDDCKNVT